MIAGGLCDRCRHARSVRSDRDSVFLLCGLSRTDPRFPRYPRLPVLACPGFEPARVGARDEMAAPFRAVERTRAVERAEGVAPAEGVERVERETPEGEGRRAGPDPR